MDGVGEGCFVRQEEFVLQEVVYSEVKPPGTPWESVAL